MFARASVLCQRRITTTSNVFHCPNCGQELPVSPDKAGTVVDVNIYDGMATVTVRVDSSQKGGSRITKLWDYRLRRMGDDWKISTLTERD